MNTSILKECSRPSCKRKVTDFKRNGRPYKNCKPCRDRVAKSRKKCYKRKYAEILKDDHKRCGNCKNQKLKSYFVHQDKRYKTLTSNCQTCRDNQNKSRQNPDTAKGACLAFFTKWRKENLICGGCNQKRNWKCIEADHKDPTTKITELSHLEYWAIHGGVPAMEKEALKCGPLCSNCHARKSKNERGTQKQKDRLEKRAIINVEKYRIGKCSNPKCDEICTAELGNECSFGFKRHKILEGACKIASLIHKPQKEFDRIWEFEKTNITMFCMNCCRTGEFFL